MELKVRNVNEAISRGIHHLIVKGIKEESRNGTVLVAPTPVMTIYEKPCERVLFSPLRDANPFFHLMESLWMLAGRDDVAFPATFNKRFTEYSDDGETVHGAYGERWRRNFGYDQLQIISDELIKNPASRRCVLAMWDACPPAAMGSDDLRLAVSGGKDVPCNTHIYFDVRDNKLNMTVCCRSNDIIWGAYGANAVHMSILQEYMAKSVGVEVGLYRQFSNNYHAYTDVYHTELLNSISIEAHRTNYYQKPLSIEQPAVAPYPLISTDVASWDKDLHKFLDDPLSGYVYHDPFFKQVAEPMWSAWMVRKDKQGDPMEHVRAIVAEDWKLACAQWITRREEKKNAAA